MTVTKRDGRKVKYNREKVINAVLAAFNDVDGEITPEAKRKATLIANSIEELNKESLGVEEIQDIVETELMNGKRKDVAKQYIIYRNNRSMFREQQSEFMKKVYGKANATDIENSNANVNEHSFSGREKEASAVLGKHMAFELNGLSKEVADAHKNMLNYQHDADKAVYGIHNCLNVNFQEVFKGFVTRNGDVRTPGSFSTACQLIAVAFQCQSQVQFGGVGTIHLDYDLAPYVKKSFVKAYVMNIVKQSDELLSLDLENLTDEEIDEWVEKNKKEYLSNVGITENDVYIDNKDNLDEKLYYMSYFDLIREGRQSAQALFHNLNTLESRQGSQLPFTSINLGRDTSTEGRLVTKWILNASIDGIGRFRLTSIFPISIFQYKVGTNAKKEDKNYDMKQLALKSMSKRIYPNWANGGWSQAHEDENNPDTYFSTMGCVDGKEIITYKFNNELFVESFERMWNRLTDTFEIKHQYNEKNPNLYMDLDNIEIYDTEKGFVNTKRIIRNVSNNWVDVHLSNGRRLLCTEDHPFELLHKGKTQAKDLKISDKMMINSSQYNEESIIFNSDKAWLLGFMLCDGCYQSNHIFASIAAEGEDEIEEKFHSTFSKYFGLNTKTVLQERGKRGTYKDLVAIADENGNLQHTINYLTSKFGGINKVNRHIPNEVFSWNYESKMAFLAGMIDADGYLNDNAHGGSVVQIGSTNKELALQQMALAQALGMPAKIYHNHYTKKNPNAIRYRVEFYAIEELLTYIVCDKKCEHYEDAISSHYNTQAEVIEVLPVETEMYSYDVTTDSEHFEVSGIYSHNCRTLVGYDRHGLGYIRQGRGNNVPNTIILPKLGIEYGICLGERTEPDLEGFWKAFEDALRICEKGLLERYAIIKKQSPKAAPFMYQNHTIQDSRNCEDTVENAVKHNTLAMGYIGIAEMCQALFGKNHAQDENVHAFALSVVKRINEYASEASERNDLNFSCYATPAEGLCRTALQALRKQYGVIENVTSHEYLTNSHHVPVWEKVSIYRKLELEAPFTKYPTGGCITYIELSSTFVENTKAVEDIIDYAFQELDIPYLAFNFPIDNCLDCGYQGEFNNECPMCGSKNIQQLRRVTGYLTTDYRNFNDGKQAEVEERVKHSAYTDFGEKE